MSYKKPSQVVYPEGRLRYIAGRKFNRYDIEFNINRQISFIAAILFNSGFFILVTLAAYVFESEWTLGHVVSLVVFMSFPTVVFIKAGVGLMKDFIYSVNEFKAMKQQAQTAGFEVS